jgi:uncharacterized protein
MAVYYLESAALVKRYAVEAGTARVQALCDPGAGNLLLISRLTTVEIVAALCQKAYRPLSGQSKMQITEVERDQAIKLFRRDLQRRAYQVLAITAPICVRAGDLAGQYRLRAYDAVHLATALHAQDALRNSGATVTFLTSDLELVQASQGEGLVLEDPSKAP